MNGLFVPLACPSEAVICGFAARRRSVCSEPVGRIAGNGRPARNEDEKRHGEACGVPQSSLKSLETDSFVALLLCSPLRLCSCLSSPMRWLLLIVLFLICSFSASRRSGYPQMPATRLARARDEYVASTALRCRSGGPEG